MTRYVIKFTFGKDMNAVEVCEFLKKHNVDIGVRTSHMNNEYLINGTMENLIGFITDVFGPTSEDYIYENQVAAFA